MSAVNEKEFNSIFISYAHTDEDFARRFRDELQSKLGQSIYVWLDDDLLEGKNWRRELQRRLDAASLVVLILSPQAIQSSWVLYEWHSSLLVHQSEPFLIHFRKCESNSLKRIVDYQLSEPLIKHDESIQEFWAEKNAEINRILDAIDSRLKGFSKLKTYYETLTDIHARTEDQKAAAYELGSVSEDLKLAATNYLIEALQFWLSHGINGDVGMSIAYELGRLGKKKAIPALVQFFLSQVNGKDMYMPALNATQTALALLSSGDCI